MLAVVGDGTPGWRGRFQREVHIKSTGSRPRGKYTVGAGEAAVAGAVTAARGYCGRATPDKDLVRPADGQGASPGPTLQSTAGGAVPMAAAVRQNVRVEMRSERG